MVIVHVPMIHMILNALVLIIERKINVVVLYILKMIKYLNTKVVFQEIPDEISLAINITN